MCGHCSERLSWTNAVSLPNPTGSAVSLSLQMRRWKPRKGLINLLVSSGSGSRTQEAWRQSHSPSNTQMRQCKHWKRDVGRPTAHTCDLWEGAGLGGAEGNSDAFLLFDCKILLQELFMCYFPRESSVFVRLNLDQPGHL